jgi:predicted nucleic acid-binding protein
VIFDTDVIIWARRGSTRAARLMDQAEQRLLSVQSYMELLQCAGDKRRLEDAKSFLRDVGFVILPLTENIGHRAAVYVEEYSLSNGLRAGDAIIAATATENGLTLCTSNEKHFRPIKDLRLEVFHP